MRSEARIDPFLDKIGVLWKQNPDLRFGQMVMIVFEQAMRDPFFVEESEWEKIIDKMLIKEGK